MYWLISCLVSLIFVVIFKWTFFLTSLAVMLIDRGFYLYLIWGAALGTDTSVSSPHKHLSVWTGLNPAGEPPVSACLTRPAFYCTLMGPSTGSSPCSDSCFKALRAAWERETTTDGWVSGEGRVRDRVGGEWVSPFSCFSNNTYAGKPDASRTLSLALCCLWLLCNDNDVYLVLLRKTFPLYISVIHNHDL